MAVPEPQVDSTDEDGSGDEEHDRRTLEEEIVSPFPKRIQLALTVRAAFCPRPALVYQVIGQEPSHQMHEDYSYEGERAGCEEEHHCDSVDVPLMSIGRVGFDPPDGPKDHTEGDI